MSDTDGADAILASLAEDLLFFVEDQLSNNDVCSDEEMHENFVSNGLTSLQATRALHYRSSYLLNMFMQGHTPILKGGNALRFDPNESRFKLIGR